jgi:hypothetical protein
MTTTGMNMVWQDSGKYDNQISTRAYDFQQSGNLQAIEDLKNKIEEEDMAEDTRRAVMVFIVDPDKNIPVDKGVLHRSEIFMTDLTNEELFFDIEIKKLLDAHNKYRKTVKKKKSKKNEKLDEIRIKDLKMVVVDLATF